MSEETFLRKFDHVFIADLIKEKGKYISNTSIRLFMDEAIDNPKLHEPDIFRAIQFQVLNHHSELIICDEKTFRKIIRVFYEKCSKCNAFHKKDILLPLFRILDGKFQKRISRLITKSLQAEFNPELYYTYAIHQIIEYSIFWEQFMESCPRLEQKQHWSPWGKREASYDRLNELINLAYKFNIDLSAEPFNKYRNITPYYDWLLNIDGFDYQQFNSEWILEYKTTYYLEKIFTSDKVKRAVTNHLLKAKHPILNELFIRYTKDDGTK